MTNTILKEARYSLGGLIGLPDIQPLSSRSSDRFDSMCRCTADIDPFQSNDCNGSIADIEKTLSQAALANIRGVPYPDSFRAEEAQAVGQPRRGLSSCSIQADR